MTYPLLETAPAHNSPLFIDYLRDNNEVLYENDDWIIIENCKYNWPTAFAKTNSPDLSVLIQLYGDYEWRVKPKDKRTVTRFHIHIIV